MATNTVAHAPGLDPRSLAGVSAATCREMARSWRFRGATPGMNKSACEFLAEQWDRAAIAKAEPTS